MWWWLLYALLTFGGITIVLLVQLALGPKARPEPPAPKKPYVPSLVPQGRTRGGVESLLGYRRPTPSAHASARRESAS